MSSSPTGLTAFASIEEQYGRLVSISRPCPGVNLTRFLRYACGVPRFYWESQRDDVAFAGMGVALELMAWGADRFKTVQQRAGDLFAHALMLDEREPLAAPRLFGGFAFRDDFVPDQAWSDFTPAHLVLPHYQLVRAHDATWLTLNAHVPLDENPYALAADLRAALNARIAELQTASLRGATRSPLTHLHYPLARAAWTRGIEQATTRIKAGELQKVVLARIAEASFAGHVAVDDALDHLAQAYPNTYRFLFEPRPYHAFFGATPELLASVQGGEVATMALAGSIGRGATPEADAELARQLLASAKDRHEHQIVVDQIRARLAPLTTQLAIGATGVLTLSNIQHIHTPITGKLRHNSGILPVIETLHPTPALGGEPRDAAMALIGDLEPFPRGWYAAPVGWIDCRMDGQFSVAIRSAVAQDARAWLYAGAGIVADSDPQREWDETALKFKPMLDALGIAPRTR